MEDRKTQEKELEFMDLEEVASYLKVSMSTIYRYINPKENKNPLPHFKLTRGHIIVKKSELNDWIENYRKFDNK